MNILCLGASFTGRYLWRNFSDRHRVFFLSRRSQQLAEAGLAAFSASEWHRVALHQRIDAVLDTVPAIAASDSGEDIAEPPYLREVGQVFGFNPSARLIHVGSTSVYPSHLKESDLPGLDEDTAARSGKRGGKRRLLLEQRWMREYPDLRVIRSAGIYGPGRCLALRFKQGDFRRAAEGNRVVSRIHVHDLCRLILALAEAAPQKPAPTLVHAVDESPVPNREVFEFLEEMLGIQVPGNWRQEPPRGRKIVSLHAKQLLGGTYRHPSYRQGFAACLEV